MKRLLATTMLAGTLCLTHAAGAALLNLGPDTATEGLVYTLEAQATANPLTEQFALVIAGVNSGLDTRGGRTGINAFAFNLVTNNPDSPFTGTFLGTRINGVTTLGNNGFNFVPGGLNSDGCNTTGNFFCFDNTLIPPTPVGLLNGPIVLGFEVTLLPGGSWADYTTALKIDWVGSANNYSLVSEAIPLNTTCPDCIINPQVIVPTPEPASLAILGVALLGVGYARRKFQ